MNSDKESKKPSSKSPMSQIYGYQGDLVKEEKPEPVYTAPDNQDNESEKNSFFKKSLIFVWEIAKIAIVAAIIILPIRYFLFQPFIVKGDSMVPNLHSGNYLIIDEISYRFAAPSRGDIIVLKYPIDTTQRFIKRIIGLPGETVQIKNGNIHIVSGGGDNKDTKKDITLNEKSYLPLLKSTDGDTNVTLGPDDYFVLGDNRAFSYDSRRWGILPKKDIIGKAVLLVWPFSNMSYMTAPSYQ